MSLVRLSVPGNILLLGEYAVLEEGGRGVAMAVDTRVRLETAPASSLKVECVWPGSTVPSTPITDVVVETVSEWLGRSPAAEVRVDSSAFFSSGGRKAGLGSSAAVSVALVCGLLLAAGEHEAARGPEALSLALRAHRKAQGGRGSGYDIFTSFHGGTGIFLGGQSPGWEPFGLAGEPEVLLFPGPAPVPTSEAVARYSEWKDINPSPARDFLQESNRAILSFVAAGSLAERLTWFGVCRNLGIELGKSIGVPAELSVPPTLDPAWCKALGAGNELGLCLLPPGARPPEDDAVFRLVRCADTGVTWEE